MYHYTDRYLFYGNSESELLSAYEEKSAEVFFGSKTWEDIWRTLIANFTPSKKLSVKCMVLKLGEMYINLYTLFQSNKQRDERKWPQAVPGRFRLDIVQIFFIEGVVKH